MPTAAVSGQAQLWQSRFALLTGPQQAKYPPFGAAVALRVTIGSGTQIGQICAVVRIGQGLETSSSSR